MFLEQASGLVSLLVWLAFGAIAVPIVVDNPDPTTLLYAALSLTLVRMVPVALGSLGAPLDRETVLFIGWFGPRGLASLVFALLALEELGPGAPRGGVRHRRDGLPQRARPRRQRRPPGRPVRTAATFRRCGRAGQ